MNKSIAAALVLTAICVLPLYGQRTGRAWKKLEALRAERNRNKMAEQSVRIIRASERHFSDHEWLQTYWLFSFSDYYDPRNIQFGDLRVFNDDVVQPGKGFPTHPHEEMEIITIVLDGEMTHRDSMGNKAVIRSGDVQRMSAGTGLTHSEFNLARKPVHFYQIWFFPNEKRLKPSYAQKNFSSDQWQNKLFPVASGQGIENTVSFHTAATIYRSKLDKGVSVTHTVSKCRRIFVYVTSGELLIDGEHNISKGDQARLEVDEKVSIEALAEAEFVLIDADSCKGYGYDQKTLSGGKE